MNDHKIIFSKHYDVDTDVVIDWLLFMGEKNVLRLNGEDFLQKEYFKIELQKDKIYFHYPNKIKIDSIWVRKGTASKGFDYSFIHPENLRDQVSKHLTKEAEECKLDIVLLAMHGKAKVIGVDILSSSTIKFWIKP